MPQTSQALTPPEILDAGHKAESEGRVEYAVQFYRHLTNYYARTPEAADARQALQRLTAEAAANPAAPHSLSRALESQRTAQPTPIATQAGPPATARPRPRRDGKSSPLALPPPAHRYWIGRALATVLLIAGALSVVAGAALLGFGLMFGFDRPMPAGMTLISVTAMFAAPGLILVGLVLALVGQLCSAAFRTANASADVAAIARAKALHDIGED